MRTCFLTPILLIAGMMLGACNEANTEVPDTVGVVDVSRALRDSDAGKSGMKFLEGIQKELLGEVEKIQARLKANPKDEAAQQQLQTAYMALQQRLQAEQQNVVGRLNDMFQRVLDTYRVRNRIVAVIPSDVALSYDKKIDVTEAVIAGMNKEKVDFTPVAATPDGDVPDSAEAPEEPEEQEVVPAGGAKKEPASSDKAGAAGQPEKK